MKHSNFSRFLSVMLALVMVLSMLPAAVFAAESATYTRVTADQTDWSGEYLLVYEAGSLAFDGSLSTPDAVNNYQAVTIDGDTITADPAIAVTIEAVDGGYVLKSASGLYLYHNTEANKLSSTANQSTAAKYPLTIQVVDDGVDLALSSGPHMRFNANADQMRFRYYKSSSYTNQMPVTLFKLSEGGSTEPVTPERATGLVTDLTTLRSGDSIVIFNPANGKTLSSTYSGFYNAATAVSFADGVLTGYTDADVWTLGINADGSYTFATAEGKKISMGASYTSMPLDDVNSNWNITASNTEGCFYIENPVRGAYMEYQPSYDTWSAYYSINDEALFAQQLYLIVEGSTPVDPDPSEPEPSESEPSEPAGDTATYLAEAPLDGDTVLIYNAANTAVMGAAANGKKLAGISAAAENESIVLTEEMAQLVVGVEEEVYTFTLDGKYLTSADTGNGLSFSEELTDMGRWTLEQKDDGKFIIMNVGANYNGNHNQALEYYSGFTTYGVKETDIYKMDFYLVSRPQQSGIVTELHEGDSIVIFNPANSMALSTTYTGYYNAGTPVVLADDKLTGFTEADIWTVGVNDDGTYTFATSEGKKLSMGASFSSMPLDDVNTAWSIETAKTENCFYIKNVARGNYIEWYADKNNWSSYYNNSNEALFAQMFYLVGDEISEPETGLPTEGDEVVIYNLSSQGVLGAENDTQSIENVTGYVEENTFIADNGAVVFTVSRNGNYYRFYNETYGYLCSNGTGNNAFYSQEASNDADWTLHEGKSGGYNLESRTAKYNGQYSQYLEYYGDSYKTYSMYNVTDYDIYEFFFYPLNTDFTMGSLVGGIVNDPKLIFSENTPVKGQDFVLTFTVEAIFGLDGDMEVKIFADPTGDGSASYEIENGCTLTGPDAIGVYTITVPAAVIAQCGAGISVDVTAVDTVGSMFGSTMAYEIVDEPSIVDITPAANSQTLDDKRPAISAKLVNAGYDATAAMTVNGEAVEAELLFVEDGSGDMVIIYKPEADMADGRTAVTVTVTRADGKTATKSWSFTVGEQQYELYFGQLHSHTTYSDGSGSLESALSYIGSLPESANVDFVAFTDHSNYFDNSSSVNPEAALYDMSLAGANSQNLWSAYKGAIADFNASQSKVVAIGGFEMTWSGGPGHINTFATPGIVSRNNGVLNNKTADAGMKAYYALLSQAEGIDGISQFNHPGTTFGNFTDFAYWDAVIDSRIQLVEVGNGEGQIGAGGYYPSYEQYTMALDKGWHLAPTNNQDNHKGKWGNANDARDVVLTADFTEEGIYEAIRNYRVYATEDKNLEIGYTVNGLVLGSIISEVPEKLDLAVTVYDPDTSDSVSKVEVIVNSGKVAHTWDDPAELSGGMLTATLAPDYSYYYLRVTQGDGDIAVTAPVWVGEILKLGISAVECGTSTPVTGEELTISTTLFNSELLDATVKSLTYTVGSQVLAVDNTGYTVPASGNTTIDFKYTPDTARVMKVTVTAVVELDGVEYTFSMDVKLDVQDASKLVYIGIDASHYNEYVAGNYKDSMGNFGQLAAGYSVRTVELKTSEELIAACSNEKYTALILTAPSRRLAAAQEELRTYTAEEMTAIKAFNAAGGTVILAGWSDNYENYSAVSGMTAAQHMAATQNALLAELGSSLRITDDATHDNSLNGGQTQRLYFNAYNFDSFLLDGVELDPENPNDRLYTEVYSQYGGASIHVVDESGAMTSEIPATVTPIVFGHDTTYSKDTDNDGIGGSTVPEYAYAEGDDRLMVLASEELPGQGLIIVAGAAFMSNFEVQATIEDSGSEKNYSNYKICENLVSWLNPATITDIADVQAQTEEGVKYTIEGVVTSNASGYDKDTAFFDCIYLQDATAGINAFPVAGNYKIGDKVRITGTTSSYQGERQIAVSSIELISEGHEVAPVEISAAELNDGSVLGSLVTLKGTVESFEYANGLIQTIMVKDASGEVGRIFIDGYITTAYDVLNLKVGAYVVATGLASYDNSFDGPAPRIRIRDRRDVLVTVDPTTFEDISEDGWYYDAVCAMVDNGIMAGRSETKFDPAGTLTRAEWVTMLYRAAGSPAVSELSSFTDVPADSWCAEAFAWAEDMGIVAGVAPGKVAPTMAVTREQLVIMLHRFAGSPYVKYDLSVYTDIDLVSYYAFDSFEWAVANGYVTGVTATTLAPQALTNRAQAATILAHCLGLI